MFSDGLGLFQWWRSTDLVTSGVYIYLAVCIVATWLVIVLFTLRLRHLERLELALRRDEKALTPAQLRSAVSFKLVRQCRKTSRERSGQGFERRLFAALHRQRVSWQSFPVGLAAIGVIAPVVGVFGSVWVMLSTLQEFQALAGGMRLEGMLFTIVVSIIPTLISLLVAVPALTGYRLLQQRTHRLTALVETNMRRLRQRLNGRRRGASIGEAA